MGVKHGQLAPGQDTSENENENPSLQTGPAHQRERDSLDQLKKDLRPFSDLSQLPAEVQYEARKWNHAADQLASDLADLLPTVISMTSQKADDKLHLLKKILGGHGTSSDA